MATKKMQSTDSDSEFTRLAEALSKDPRVDDPSVARAKGFGSKGLKVACKLFAFESKGRLVLKLPADRVQQLSSSRQGKPFDPGHGRIMKEWVAIDLAHKTLWRDLAREALDFAARNVSPGTNPRKTTSSRGATKRRR